jgi:hypothetical protein
VSNLKAKYQDRKIVLGMDRLDNMKVTLLIAPALRRAQVPLAAGHSSQIARL